VSEKWISRGVVTAVDEVDKPQPIEAGCGFPFFQLARGCEPRINYGALHLNSVPLLLKLASAKTRLDKI